MADKKISEMTAASAYTGANEFYEVVQGGNTRQGSHALLKAYFDTLYPTAKTYITAQATPTRVTAAAPDAIGEYRSYLRAGSGRTFSETNGSPTTAPSSTNGYLLYANSSWAGGDASNQPSRYEIFVGIGKDIQWEFYKSTGRSGFIDPVQFYAFGGANYDGGCVWGYDAALGIAWITKARPSGIGTVAAGTDETSNPYSGNIYFDIKC